jgi:hypothetical protein
VIPSFRVYKAIESSAHAFTSRVNSWVFGVYDDEPEPPSLTQPARLRIRGRAMTPHTIRFIATH